LVRTRWPEPALVGDARQGVPPDWLQDLCAYWADGYDWRGCRARLNAAPQFTIDIDGVRIHFLHVRSPHAQALFLDVLGR
jgi:hypothetical protein